MTAKAKQILQWLKHGLDIHWVPYDGFSQRTHPRYRSKVQLVKDLLLKTIGAQGVEPALHGKEPKQVHFNDCVSIVVHEEFVDGAIYDLLRTGAIRPWTDSKPITVISGLGVAVDREGQEKAYVEC